MLHYFVLSISVMAIAGAPVELNTTTLTDVNVNLTAPDGQHCDDRHNNVDYVKDYCNHDQCQLKQQSICDPPWHNDCCGVLQDCYMCCWPEGSPSCDPPIEQMS